MTIGATLAFMTYQVYRIREGKIDRIDLDIEFDGPLTNEQRSKLLEIVEKCPVHRTLISEIDIRTRVGLDDPEKI